MPGGDLVELAQAHPWLHNRNLIVNVDLKDGAHLPERDEDAALSRHASSRQPGARTPRRDGSSELASDRDDLSNLGCGMGEDDHIGRVPVSDE